MSIPPCWHAGEDHGLGDCQVKGGPKRKKAASFPSFSPPNLNWDPSRGIDSGMARKSHATVPTGLWKEMEERKALLRSPLTHSHVCL